MSNYLTKAIDFLGVTPEQVVKHRINEAEGVYILLADYGGGGIKKHIIPLVDLDEPPQSEPVPQELPEIEVTAGARKLAKAEGIDLAEVPGTLKGGKINIDDVRNFINRAGE
jgi:hypothetical protein